MGLTHFALMVSFFTPWKHQKTYLISGQCYTFIETSQLIWIPNQLTGFYMRVKLAWNRLTEELLGKSFCKILNKNRCMFMDVVLVSLMSNLTLSWLKSLRYRNQSIDLQSKSMDWFLYDRNSMMIELNRSLLFGKC